MATKDYKQSTRLVILLLYIGLLLGASLLALGHLPPAPTGKGLWFYTGIVSLILGNLLITPFYTTPKDALANVLLAATALYAVNDWQSWGRADRFAFIMSIGYFAFIAFAAIGTILIKDSRRVRTQQLANALRIVCEDLGNQKFVFTAVILFAVFAFHRSSAREMLIITLAWTATVALQPGETSVKLWRRLRGVIRRKETLTSVGELVACQSPGIILIRQTTSERIIFGEPLFVKDPYEAPKIALALDYIGRDEGLLLRAIEIEATSSPAIDLLASLASYPDGGVLRINDANNTLTIPELREHVERRPMFVGIVAPDTSVQRLYFEVVQNTDLEEGRLVEVGIGRHHVLYQVIDGLTKEEIIRQKNTFGFARAQARKIGIWDQVNRKFRAAKWIPLPNSPVYLKVAGAILSDVETIGHFPGSGYPVRIESMDTLVTHNAAILGILGIGKTMVAIELVERMIANGTKVICLDLTNQYAAELSAYYSQQEEAPKLQRIREAGEAMDGWQEDPEQGGSLPRLRQAILEDLSEFLNDDSDRHLKIYNPAEIVATKQLREPGNFRVDENWQRRAALWSVTPVEVTSIVAEVALDLLQDQMSDDGRVCLVLEEAHSLVPEFGTVASEGDKAATNKTARAILQGRKYGFGCLLITQRTANVTKTILNQCNTIFAMRTFDDTSKEFLANYIGSDYAGILPSLEERQAVFFGKASSCENPVLMRVNNKEDFRERFRVAFPPAALVPREPAPQPSAEIVEPPPLDIDDDDIPF